MISHDNIIVNSSSVAFDLYTKLDTSYRDQCLSHQDFTQGETVMPFVVEGLDLDLRMRNFEFFSLVPSYPFDSPRPTHLKATGRIKFMGKIKRHSTTDDGDAELEKSEDAAAVSSLVGEISISSLKLNQLILAPQLAGRLSVSRDHVKVITCFLTFGVSSFISISNTSSSSRTLIVEAFCFTSLSFY